MKISVVMAVYNASEFLKEAIDSILNQTLADWELIAVDDCSTDDSLNLLKSYSDPRIKIFENNHNSGPAITRNKALKLAAGDYIAIMDADDVSFSHRFEVQVCHLESHPDVAIVGAWVKAINNKGDFLFDIQTPVTSRDLKTRLLLESAMVHSSTMIRAEIIQKYNLFYDEYFTYAQDFELFTRASQYVNLENIPEYLVKYRYSPSHISTKDYEKQSLYGIQIIENQYKNIGLKITKEQIEILYSLLYKFRYLNNKERILILNLFFTLFLLCRQSEDYSMNVLANYFKRLYRLACSGKGGKFRYLFVVFDLVPVLKIVLLKQPIFAFSYTRFYFLSLIA